MRLHKSEKFLTILAFLPRLAPFLYLLFIVYAGYVSWRFGITPVPSEKFTGLTNEDSPILLRHWTACTIALSLWSMAFGAQLTGLDAASVCVSWLVDRAIRSMYARRWLPASILAKLDRSRVLHPEQGA